MHWRPVLTGKVGCGQAQLRIIKQQGLEGLQIIEWQPRLNSSCIKCRVQGSLG